MGSFGGVRRRWWSSLLGAGLLVLIVAGCGGATSSQSSTARQASQSAAPQPPAATVPAHPPVVRTTPPAGAVRVIRSWANALRRGDVLTAASYFRLPSEMINAVGANGLQQLIRIHTLTEAEQAQETLPCGARFISASKRGPFVNALFRLTGRSGPGGTGCGSGVGQTARTDFVIRNGKIVEWLRAPDEPGDNQNGGPPSSNGPAPVV